MKAFLVIPTLTVGGAERVVSIIANNWSNRNIDVHIVLLVGGKVNFIIKDNIVIHHLNFPINRRGFYKLFELMKLLFAFRKLSKLENPDFVLSFMNKYNVFVLFSLIGLNKRIIVSERDSPTEKLSYLVVFLRNIFYKYADGVLCQTEDSRRFIIAQTGNKNVISIPNPVEFKDEIIGIPKEKIILNVGRLVEKKGQKFLLEIFSNLKCNNWNLVILGDGPLKESLINLAKELNIYDRVMFIGSTSDVNTWYKKSSIFAFTSILEGFPNSLAEAMVNGLPCISFNCKTGPSDIIIHGVNGVLIEEKNIKGFVDQLQMLIDNEELRNSYSTEAVKLINKLNSDFISNEYLKFCTNTI